VSKIQLSKPNANLMLAVSKTLELVKSSRKETGSRSCSMSSPYPSSFAFQLGSAELARRLLLFSRSGRDMAFGRSRSTKREILCLEELQLRIVSFENTRPGLG
jgi:hypothetical protein